MSQSLLFHLQPKMQLNFLSNSQIFSSKSFLFEDPLCNLNSTYFPNHTKTSLSQSLYLHSLPNQTQIQTTLICSRNRKRVPGFKKLTTILPHLLSFLASNSQILPEPLSLAITEFGGGSGFLKGFKWGSFNGWNRKKKVHFRFDGILVIIGLLLLFFIGREFKSEVFVAGVLVLGSLGGLLSRKYKRRVKDFVLGICFVVALVVLGLRREEMQKCVERSAFGSSVLKLVKKPRRNGRRRLF